METAVAYIRVSSQKQVEEGNSLESQEKQVKAYAQSHGFKLVHIFREEGQSAKTDRRPVLLQMLKHCSMKKSDVKVVIIPKIDRLARNVMDYSNIKLRLHKYGVRIESISERIEDTPAGRFTETIFASVAQFDNEMRSERSRGGMEDAARDGRWVWKAPLGYRNVRINGQGTIEPDPETAPKVRFIFEQLAKGHQGLRTIRGRLAEMGVPINRGYLYRLIENPVYIGKIESFGGVFEGKPPFVPLIDELTAYKAKAALRPSNSPQQYQAEHPDFPLRGTALCQCGVKFTASWSRGKTGARFGYFRCPRCGGKNYSMARIEEEFTIFLEKWEHNEVDWPALVAELTRLEEASRSDFSERRAEQTKKIAELQALRSAIVVKNANGVIPDDVAKAELDRIGNEILEVRSKLEAEEPRTTASKTVVEFAKTFLLSLGKSWPSMSLESKRDLLRFMFPKGVSFDPDAGFGTPRIPLLEEANDRLKRGKSTLVDLGDEFWNLVRNWLYGLHERFGVTNQESSETLQSVQDPPNCHYCSKEA